MNKLKQNKYIALVVKFVLSVTILGFIIQAIFVDGVKPYCSYKDYNYQNDFSDGQINSLVDFNQISQNFVAKGNILDNMSVYLGEIAGENIEVSIFDESGKVIFQTEILASGYSANSWNKIGGNGNLLKRDKIYTVSFASEDGLGGLYFVQGNAPIIFRECFDKNGSYPGALALGFQFTYSYLTLGSAFELMFKVVASIFIGLLLCYAIWNIEKLVETYRNSEKNKGFLYALYFSVSLVLLYNPIDSIRTEMTEFSRVIGPGVVANVDVSKRISNFSHWFIFLAVSFSLLYLWANYWIQKNKNEQTKKVVTFLDNYMVLANCSLALKCITYFNDEMSFMTLYNFSSYVILLIAIVEIAYVILKLDKKITVDDFTKLFMIGTSLSYPIAIFLAVEWSSGRVLIGVLLIISIIEICICKFSRGLIFSKHFKPMLDAGIMIFTLLPMMTSFFIELIHVLNQYGVFVAYPLKYFKIAFILTLVLFVLTVVIINKKKVEIKNWKEWVFPCFVLGITFLSVQIPISSVYNTDIMEDANYSILISDFLGYGKIPIVEHYGGHMMESVWEGILYAFVNNDYAGAVVSPYASLITPFLAVLFYYFVKYIWDENMALLVALLFPVMQSWSYFGLGMLVCVAAMAYVKKNSYIRAALLWTACIWCAIYRLDLGFAYGIAVVISMIIYIVATKSFKALKELGLTFICWGIIGGGVWSIICIVKGIHPLNRLIEFLMISLSNQNWAYSYIGDPAITLFSWSYIIIPFLIVICLLCTVFSKSIRERIGNEKWILLLILGWSYFENFSRGIVRHSLVETATTIIIWTGYVFLALFVSCYREQRKLFLPIFMLLILCNTLLIQDGNYISISIADNAVSRPASIIESWEPGRFDEEKKLNLNRVLANGVAVSDDNRPPDNFMTYWEQLKHNQEVVNRVEFSEGLEKYVVKYDLLNELLNDDETFVDFINMTSLYSLLGKENPVYISQSPLQLSGEFTQKEFIKEISGVPIVLMPVYGNNYCASLDGVANVYRNYKVAEYIYQNYAPLCQYGADYAVWCLNDRYDEYKQRISSTIAGMEYANNLVTAESIELINVELSTEGSGVKISFTGSDPMIAELQNMIDLSSYVNKDIQIIVRYETDTAGQMQLFYTTDMGEDYNGEKAVTVDMVDKGTASFTVPITEYTRIRLDIPEESIVKINSLIVKEAVEFIDYGYDGPIGGTTDEDGNIAYDYINELHNYNINQLPRIWAEGDKKNSNNNEVVCNFINNGKFYTFGQSSFEPGVNGNYLKLSATYDGVDTGGLYENDDEQIGATIILGYYDNDQFTEKCRYGMSIMEGKHDYLIRCSTDYYWYLKEINTVRIQCDGVLYNIEMKILEGD